MSRVSEDQGQFESYTRYMPLTNTFVRDERLAISYDAPEAYSSFWPCKDNIREIKAAVIPARVSIVVSEFESNEYRIKWTKQHFMLWADCPGPSGDDLRGGDECLCLLLGRDSSTYHYYFVVLRNCLGSEGGSFHRIGITEFGPQRHSQFEDAEVRRLSVI